MKRHKFPRTVSTFSLATLILLPPCAAGQGYEVWMTDQNNTAGYTAQAPRGTHGGRLFIYNGEDLDNPNGAVNRPEIIDLAVLFAMGGPNNSTGANVSRPHMIIPSPTHDYYALAFVASGHVAVIDGLTRQPKVLFRMSAGAGGARQAHAAFWTQDGTAIIVANQNGKLLERINYNPATDIFTHDVAATLNLATCTTPGGRPCESATPLNTSDPAHIGPHNRPDNAPICPVTTINDKTIVTLRGGGLFVVDHRATPMAIVGEYGNSMVGRDGCGGVQSGASIYLLTGAGTTVTNPSAFYVWELKDRFPSAPNFLPPNAANIRPRFWAGNASDGRDGHGLAISAGGHYLWVFDRSDMVDIYRLPNAKYAGGINLRASGLSADPTPDLVTLSPLGNRFYASLRGPKPQTGSPHVAVGSTPGLGIIEITKGGASGHLSQILRTTFTNPVDQSEESDPHGICVRLN